MIPAPQRRSRPSWLLLGAAAAAVIFAGVVGGRLAAIPMVMGACAFPVLLLRACGADGSAGSRRRFIVRGLSILLLGSGAVVYALAGRGPIVAGLPIAGWSMLVGLIALPALLVGFGHAWTFDEASAEEPAPSDRALSTR